MTVHRISSVLNKQVLYETLAIFFVWGSFFFFSFHLEWNILLLKWWQSAQCHRTAFRKQRGQMPCVLLCFFTLLSGKNTSCYFPGGSPGHCLRVKRHHGAALDSFLSIRFSFFFFFFAYCNHSALLLHRFPSCSASAVSLVKSRKSVAEQLRNKQQIMASKRKSREHLCF